MMELDERKCGEIITDQWNYPEIRGSFGLLGSVRKNGCGSIALHNLLCLLGYHSYYREILHYFQKLRGATLCFGLLGSNPFFIRRVLKNRKDLTCHVYKCRTEQQAGNIPKKHQAYLNLYFYRFGSHYTASLFHNDKLMVLNDQQADCYSDYFRKVKAFYMITIGVDRMSHQIFMEACDKKGKDNL